MRFEQIIAAFARSLNVVGVREISSIDAFANASGLQLCMACVSPGTGRVSGYQPRMMSYQPSWSHPSHTSSHAWLAGVAQAAVGKRKRLPLADRLLGWVKYGSAALHHRDR